MVLPRQKRGEGMGRAAAVDVLGGWVGMVPASPGHAPAARGPLRPFTPQPDGGKKVGVAVGSCCYGISRMFCEQKKKKRQFAPLSGMHTHVPREKERGRRQAGSACACSGFIWPNFRM